MTCQYTTTKHKFFPMYVPFLSLSLAWHQVSLCSVVRIPTGCSAGVGTALRIRWSSSTMWLPGTGARQPGTSYKTSSLKNLWGWGSRVVGRVEGKDELRRQHRSKKRDWKNRSSVPSESPGSCNIFSRITSCFIKQLHSVRGYYFSKQESWSLYIAL